jgi:hypothetical protein
MREANSKLWLVPFGAIMEPNRMVMSMDACTANPVVILLSSPHRSGATPLALVLELLHIFTIALRTLGTTEAKLRAVHNLPIPNSVKIELKKSDERMMVFQGS